MPKKKPETFDMSFTWEIDIRPAVKKKMTKKAQVALYKRLQMHCGKGRSFRHFKTEQRAKDWLSDLPEGIRTRCHVSQVGWMHL